MFNQPESKPNEHDTPDGKKVQNYYYQNCDLVGKGGFSQVYRGIDTISHKTVAIKVVPNSFLTSTVAIQLLKNQISILKELSHDNVIRCLDAFVSKNNHYIVTEFCEGGDLEKFIERKVFLQEKGIGKLVYEIYKGLMYLNEHHIVHRDLKPANILFTAAGVPKIADFGFAVKYHKTFKDINIGSLIYMSPQGLLKKQYGPKTEVWAFGVLIYEMLHGYTPLSKCQTEAQLREKVLVLPTFRSGISLQLRSMIQLCLTVNQKHRIEMKQLSNTPYMRKLFLEYQPQKPKDLASTLSSTTNTISITSSISINPTQRVIQLVKSYQDGLTLLHYCRLIHKTCQETPSYILSQWLLNLCWSLQKIKIVGGDKEQNENLMTTIHNYWLKYCEDHKSRGLIISFADTKMECEEQLQKLKNGPNISLSKQKYNNLNMLLKETESLQKWSESNKLQLYIKSSQAQKYLQSLKQNKISSSTNTSTTLNTNTTTSIITNTHHNNMSLTNGMNIGYSHNVLQMYHK